MFFTPLYKNHRWLVADSATLICECTFLQRSFVFQNSAGTEIYSLCYVYYTFLAQNFGIQPMLYEIVPDYGPVSATPVTLPAD